MMTIGELVVTVQAMDPSHDAFVALFTPDSTAEVFEIAAVQDPHRDAQLDIYVAADENQRPCADSGPATAQHTDRGGDANAAGAPPLRPDPADVALVLRLIELALKTPTGRNT
jgi:hypothetical protein